MMKSETKNIYDGGLEAFSFAITFLITVIIPTMISFIFDKPILILLALFLNSIGVTRDYLLLIKHKKVTRRFWIERLIGILAASVVTLYSIITLIIWAYSEIADKILISDQNLFIFNLIFSILFLSFLVISCLEGIIYIVNDYGENVIHEPIYVTSGNAVDV